MTSLSEKGPKLFENCTTKSSVVEQKQISLPTREFCLFIGGISRTGYAALDSRVNFEGRAL